MFCAAGLNWSSTGCEPRRSAADTAALEAGANEGGANVGGTCDDGTGNGGANDGEGTRDDGVGRTSRPSGRPLVTATAGRDARNLAGPGM
jgi:hypothetical protein